MGMMNSPDIAVVTALASQADDLLIDADRKEAVELLREALVAQYPQVPAGEHKPIVAAVLAVLEREEFFAAGRSREDDWGEGDAGEEAHE